MLCPDCAAPKAPAARFCHQCGRKLESASTGLKAGDRRVVTALFADLVGYTQLVDELDPEEVRSRVDGALTVLGDAVVRFDGSLEKFVGDAVLAVFGAPTAHDDDALRACLCALEMQAALARLGEGSDRPLRLRVGIATGEVVAAVRDLAGIRSVALTGDCMTTAARLQQLAEPAEVLLDEATVQAAEPRIGVERVGKRLLRGQSRPILIHRLRDERRRAGNFGRAVRLVGRDAERRRLAEVIRRTARTGRGGAVVVSGEAGIGKSRLLSEMESEARAAGFGWVWIDNPPHRMGAPYHTVRAMIDALADEFGVKAGILARQAVGSQMDEETARLLFGAAAVIARDSEMLLLPEEGWDQRFTGLSDPVELATGLKLVSKWFLSGLVATQPRCFVLDDYHWMDPSSRLMLAEMIHLAEELPIVVFTGVRPPLTPEWTNLPHVEVIELNGLDEAATEELGTAVGGAELEPDSAHWLFQRTAGNALFIGEVIRMLRASGRMEHIGEALRIDREGARRSVPLSLRALLGARIDALPPGQRSALEVGAVIGVTFPEWLLCELEGRSDMGDDLCQLADAGILVRCESESGQPDGKFKTTGSWRFRHQLFHDAAYGRLLSDRRQHLHTVLADRLEAVEPAADAAELARHRIAAGDVARALPLLERAATEAEAMGALVEAEAFRQAAAALRDGRTVASPVS
jgi:adenylate cyclase